MNRCVFCEILEGRLPATFVYDDEQVVAFLDLYPWARGHTLVVPREHGQHVRELEPQVLAHLWSVGTSLANTVREAMEADAVHFLLNDGRAAFQTVPHVHLHLVPRRKGDTLSMLGRLVVQPAGLLPASRQQLEEVGAMIRAGRAR